MLKMFPWFEGAASAQEVVEPERRDHTAHSLAIRWVREDVEAIEQQHRFGNGLSGLHLPAINAILRHFRRW